MIDYYDIRKRAEKLRAINIIIGGRGIGKTYSALSFALESGKPFIYLRNTAVQMDESCSLFGNPFKRIGRDTGRDIVMEAEKRHYMIYEKIGEEKNLIGYGAALSTFANMRGVDLSDVELCIFDEFIEARKLTFNQFTSFQGFYETVNRNRELNGEAPFKVILLSNSQTLQNDILAGYGLVQKIVTMTQNGERSYSNRDIYLELPTAGVSEMKKDTANYRLIAGTAAAREALENEFTRDSFKNVKKLPINEFTPLCMVETERGMCAVWRHKSDGRIYCCLTPSMQCKIYDKDQYALFMRERGLYLTECEVRGRIYYENYECKLMLSSALRLST